jgi:hypothetical protein
MRSLLVAAVVAGMSLSGAAQTQKEIRAKPSHSDQKTQKRTEPAKVPTGRAAATPAAKNLQEIERASGKHRAQSRPAKKPAPVRLQQKQGKRENPPINFGRGSGVKGTSGGRSNEQSRVKQKRGRH